MSNKKARCPCVENSENFTMVSLSQFFVRIPEVSEEVKQLLIYLGILEFKQAVIYVRDPVRCQILAGILEEQGFSTTHVHDLVPHDLRLARLMDFKESEGSPCILVTSCCGHAMQFKNADVVIMFDEVESSPIYAHRISSKRARKGLVINFIRAETHLAVLKQVEKLHNVTISALPSEICTSSYIQSDIEREAS